MKITSYLSDALTIFIAQELLVLQCCGHTCLCLNFREFLCVCLRKFMWHFLCVTDVRINTKNPSHILKHIAYVAELKETEFQISDIGLNIFISCNSVLRPLVQNLQHSLEEIVLVILSNDKNQ